MGLGRRRAVALLLGCVLWACDGQDKPPEADFVPSEPVPVVEVAAPVTDSDLDWLPWSAAAWETAQREDKPVLLYLAAPGWDGVFADASAALRSSMVEDFVPVRVDPYRRPDVAVRYDAGGWPALMALLPDGRVFAAAVDVPPGNTWLYLRRLRAAYQERRSLIERKVSAAERAHREETRFRHAIDADRVYQDAAAAFDRPRGGFGDRHKFVEPATLLFLGGYARHNPASTARLMLHQTVAALVTSPMVDRTLGGIHTFSYTPDWRAPSGEIDAADQALLLEALWDGCAASNAQCRQLADQLLAYVTTHLWNAQTGAFHGRQVRTETGSWWTDPAIYACRHAWSTYVCARAARQLADDRLTRIATQAAGYLMSECMDASGAVKRICGEPEPAGALVDQALAGLALVEVASLTGQDDTRRAAHRAVGYVLDNLAGLGPGFDDRPSTMELDPLPAEPIIPYVDTLLPAGNALMVRLFTALGHFGRAEEILEGTPLMSPPSRRHASLGHALLELRDSHP